jgi:hypothetical protein
MSSFIAENSLDWFTSKARLDRCSAKVLGISLVETVPGIQYLPLEIAESLFIQPLKSKMLKAFEWLFLVPKWLVVIAA